MKGRGRERESWEERWSEGRRGERERGRERKEGRDGTEGGERGENERERGRERDWLRERCHV